MTADDNTKATAYIEALSLLASCLRVPTPQLFEAVEDGSLFDAAEAIIQELGEDGPATAHALEQVGELRAESEASIYDAMRTDYTYLFTTPVGPRVPIFEAQFRQKDSLGKEKPLLVVNRTAEAVDALYAKKGFRPDRKEIISGDHLSAELAFLVFLVNGETEVGAQCPDGSEVSARGFYEEHLRPWAADFFRMVVAQARTPEYQLVGLLGQNTLSAAWPLGA